MKLYLSITKMNFEEDNIEHNIIRGMLGKEFAGYDETIELPDDDKFIKDTMKIVYKKDKKGEDTEEIESKQFIIREQKTWWSFPLFELKNGKIIDFDYTKYAYFQNTKRRNMLASKIDELYNISGELKVLRETINYILKELKLDIPDDYDKMNTKIKEIINKNPKENK